MGPPQKKPGKPGDNDPSWDWVSKLIENSEIEISGDKYIGLEELKRVYRISTQFKRCLFCTRNCKRNPFCLWGLGEKYWLKKTDEDQEDGEEESDYRGEGEFIGLQNLGATCYVNSLLQLWFHNPILRPVILEWRPTHEIDSNNYVPMCPIAQLQAMFARMAFSKKKSIKPGDFVNQLNLDTSEQQDAQEFSKLFMGHIISLLSTPENQKIKYMISEAFDGEFEHETKCLKCLKVNPRRETFNELEINVCSTLELAIAEFLKIEYLIEDNRYFCTNCQSLQNAERCTKLISLPPVLNFQIKRFMYDREIMRKKKIHTEIEFPETLDMSEFVKIKYPHNGNSSKLGSIYKLTAVLIHNGQRATEGHYTSHIKDLKTGKWYKFNDESVDKVDGTKLVIKSNKEKEKSSIEGNLPSSTEGKVNGKSNGHKSDGAYMLVYTKENLAVSKPSNECILPEYLEKLVNREDAEYEKEISEAKSKKESEAKVIAERSQNIETIYQFLIDKREELKNSVRNKHKNSTNIDSSNDVDDENRIQEKIVRKAKPNDQLDVKNGNHSSQRQRNNSEKSTNSSQNNKNIANNKIVALEEDTSDLSQFDFVSLSWLSSFFNPKEDVFEIDNSDILCVHDKLNPPSAVVSKYKIIPSKIIDIFYEKVFEKNRLRGDDALCKACVAAKFDNISGLIKLDKDCKKFSEVYKESDFAVWITKDSFKSWKKYAKVALYGPNDEHEKCDFNSGIQCEHGQLDPDQTNRKLISIECWSILHKYFDTQPYLETEEPCEVCANMTVINTELAKQNKDFAIQQKNILNELYLNKNRPSLEKCGTYYAISNLFLDNWRNFIRDPQRREPEVMIMNQNLLCVEHKKFMYHQSFLNNLSPEDENADLFEKIFSFLTEYEWKTLIEKFSFDHSIKVVVTNPGSKDDVSYEPDVCIKCGTEWWINYSNKRFQFENKVIYIQKRTPEETMQENNFKEDSDSYTIPAKREKRDLDGNGRIRDPSPSLFLQGSRRSSRPRRQRGEKNYNVSSKMTVMELKKKLCADFKVLASDQHLFYKDKELKDSQATLEQCQIMPNSILYLEVDTTNGIDNYEDESMDASPETGFSGTLLCQQQNTVNNVAYTTS